METTKNIYNKSVEFIKGKYLKLALLLVLPIVLSQIIASVTGLSEAIIGQHVVIVVAIWVVATIISIFIRSVGTILPFAFIKEAQQSVSPSVVTLYKQQWRKWFTLVCASIISFVIVLAGSILFIVPGIMFSILLVFVPIIIGSTDKKALDALAHSWMIVSGRKWIFVVKSFMGGLRIVWVYAVFLIVSLSAWLYVSISGLYHDALVVTTIIGVAHVIIAVVWGLRVWALYSVFMYQLFEEFNRTTVVSDTTLPDLFKKKVKKLAWGGLVVVMLGILCFIAVFSYFGIQNLKSEILVNPQYVQAGNVQFAISASWIPKPVQQNNSHGFSVVSPIDQVIYQYVLVSATEKEEPLTFNQITTYFMSQLSDLDALKKDGTIMDYSQNISEVTMAVSDNDTILMPYIRTSTTLFDDALASNIINTSVVFEKDAFLYEVQSVCMLDYQKMCDRNIETVLIHAAFQ